MPIEGWDHLELWVGNAKQAAYFYEHAFGFQLTAYAGPETGVRDRASYVIEQGDIRLVLTTRGCAATARSPSTCSRTGTASRTSRSRSRTRRRPTARPCSAARAGSPSRTWIEDELGRVELATIATYGDTVHTFVNRSDYGGPYLPGLRRADRRTADVVGVGLLMIDHVVGNVELGRMNHWVEFYERVFGMTNILHFGDEQIHTEYSALMSKVMADGSGKIKFPINEPAEGKRKSQIEEYLEFYGGPGVAAHRARHRRTSSPPSRRCSERGVLFLDTPEAYYEEALEARVGEIDESCEDLQRLRILVDRDEDGYLLQIFTKTAQDRPTVFFEVIERHGARGFGEGNFKALFEAIEREQALRGNL